MDISRKAKLAGLDVTMRHDPQKHLEPLIKMSVDWVVSLIEGSTGMGKMMDLGGSYGFAANLFWKMGWDAVNVDRYPPEKYLVKPVKKDWEKLPKSWAETFDLVFFNHGIEHALSAYRVMEQIEKVVKPGGYLFLGCPHGMFPWAYVLEKSTTHFTLVTPEFLKVLLPRYGFKVEALELRCSRNDYVEILLLARKTNESDYGVNNDVRGPG